MWHLLQLVFPWRLISWLVSVSVAESCAWNCNIEHAACLPAGLPVQLIKYLADKMAGCKPVTCRISSVTCHLLHTGRVVRKQLDVALLGFLRPLPGFETVPYLQVLHILALLSALLGFWALLLSSTVTGTQPGSWP